VIATVVTLAAVLVALGLYSLLLIAVVVPRAYDNGRVQGRLEQALRHEDRMRESHRGHLRLVGTQEMQR
jgi:uncharacterized membrane protein